MPHWMAVCEFRIAQCTPVTGIVPVQQRCIGLLRPTAASQPAFVCHSHLNNSTSTKSNLPHSLRLC
jgi:hypothetical protein